MSKSTPKINTFKLGDMTQPLIDRLNPPTDEVSYPSTHLGLIWRPFHPEDLTAVVELVRECEVADEALATVELNHLADLLEGCGKNPCVDVIVGRNNEGVVRIFAWVEIVSHDAHMALAHVNAFVHPRWRGQGVGRSVLKWQDTRARQMLLEALGAQATNPVRIANQVDAHMHDRRRLYVAAGFSPVRTFEVMHCDLTETPVEVSPSPSGIRIQRWHEELAQATFNTHQQVFEDHWGSDAMTAQWWRSAHANVEGRWSFVAVDDCGEVVGYVITSRHLAHWIRSGTTEAYAELLGVDGSQRGSGLAKALLTRSMKSAQNSGIGVFALDVDCDNPHGARDFYARLGFSAVGQQVYYTMDL